MGITSHGSVTQYDEVKFQIWFWNENIQIFTYKAEVTEKLS